MKSIHDERVASNTEFANHQFDWLRSIAFDAELPAAAAAARVAIALTRHFNRDHGGWCWMSQSTVAKDLHTSVRTVRTALTALVKAGYLEEKRRGWTQTTMYKAASDRQEVAHHERQNSADHDRQESSAHSAVTGKKTSSDRQNSALLTGKNLPPNPYKNPISEPVESDSISTDIAKDLDADFERWWGQYPKKVDRAKARSAYRKVRSKGTATREELLTGAMRYAAERSGQDPKFTKHPTTWLNAESWENEAEPTVPAATAGTGSRPHFGSHFEQALADAMAMGETLQ